MALYRSPFLAMEFSLAYQMVHGILAFFILLLLLRATFMDPGYYGKGNMTVCQFIYLFFYFHCIVTIKRK